VLLLLACGGSDDSNDNSQPVSRNWIFTINGQSAHPGDTIHITHEGVNINIEWQDPDNPIKSNEPTYTSLEVVSGNVYYTREEWNWWSFASGPGLVKFILHDYGTQPHKEYVVYVDIKPMDLKERIDIRGTIPGHYELDNTNKYITGPFLELYIDEGLRRAFMTTEEIGISKNGMPLIHDVTKPFLKIKSFGSNKETCYPSNEDYGWYTEFKWAGNYQTSDGESFYGKVTYDNVDYWFFQFDYGDYSYEVRKYKGADNCLWNGEWE
jgi:hypothetical protein